MYKYIYRVPLSIYKINIYSTYRELYICIHVYISEFGDCRDENVYFCSFEFGFIQFIDGFSMSMTRKSKLRHIWPEVTGKNCSYDSTELDDWCHLEDTSSKMLGITRREGDNIYVLIDVIFGPLSPFFWKCDGKIRYHNLLFPRLSSYVLTVVGSRIGLYYVEI